MSALLSSSLSLPLHLTLRVNTESRIGRVKAMIGELDALHSETNCSWRKDLRIIEIDEYPLCHF